MPVKNRTLYESMESNLGSQIDITNTKSITNGHNNGGSSIADADTGSRIIKSDSMLSDRYSQIYPQKQGPSLMQGLKVLATGE